MGFTHTVTKLSPVEARYFSRFVCCIWRELKIKTRFEMLVGKMTVTLRCVKKLKRDFPHFIMKHEVLVFDATAKRK